ncbi:hypothetical protein AB5I41_24910 [Sphingomonas sp. MMS24-JH45]
MFSMSGRVPRETRLDPAVEEIVQEERPAYWANRGVKQADVLAAVLTRVNVENARRTAAGEPTLDPPGKETVRRRIAEMECRETYAEKYGRTRRGGSTTARARHLHLANPAGRDHGRHRARPRDAPRRSEGLDRRCYLCVLMDAHSRAILGLTISFRPPSVETAAETMRMAMQCIRVANSPKRNLRPTRLARYPGLATLNGKPAKIVMDTASTTSRPASPTC